MSDSTIILLGAGCFGAVVGFLAEQVYERAGEINIKWLTAMIGVIGGGAITGFLSKQSTSPAPLLAAYSIGLCVMFFISFFFCFAFRQEREERARRDQARRERANVPNTRLSPSDSPTTRESDAT